MTAAVTRLFMPAAGQPLKQWAVIALMYAMLAVTVVYPVAMIFGASFFGAEGQLGDAFTDVFTDTDVLIALWNTIKISVIAVIIAAVIGVSLAWLIARTDMPFKWLFDPLNMIPFYLSSVVGALSWQVISSPQTGLLNQLLQYLFGQGFIINIYSVGGIALVLGLFYAPYVYLFTLGSLQSMDPSLEEASRMSGASIIKTAMRVTLPLSSPAILSACLLVFVTCAGIFGVPMVLGIPGQVNTLSTLIFRSVNDYPADYATAAILSLSLFVFTAVLIGLQMYILRGRAFTTVTGKGYRPRPLKLGAWRWAGFSLNLFYVLLILGPFLALILVSVQDAWTGAFSWSRVTAANYYKVLFVEDTARRGLFNSMVISTVGATIAIFVSLMFALVVRRTTFPARQGLAFLTTMPVAVPGIVLGIGFLMAFVSTPLYGTIWLIMLAYIVHYLPTGVRNMESLVQAVSRELDESARMSGATWRQAMSKVVVPLIAPGMISTWLLLFVTFIREVSASMILFTFGTETLSIALIRIMEYEPYGVSAAFGVLQTLLLLICVVFIRVLAHLGVSRQRSAN